jgi:thiosulfate/3-mercaptopyruvate sulfurtransferase
MTQRGPTAQASLAHPELLATTAWLEEALDRPEIRILDVRWRSDGSGLDRYLQGHIPGAVYLDPLASLTEQDDEDGILLLAPPQRVAEALGRLGVGDGTTVVVYDDIHGYYAARVWWTLRVYGLEACRILDGGFAAWVREDRPVASSLPEVTPAVFTPRAQPRLRVTTGDVRGLLAAPDVIFVDARAPAEYRGLEGNTRRLGHIPGAVNLPAAALDAPGTQQLRSPAALRGLLQKAGILRGRRLICYDGSGIAAAKVAFVLFLLGYEDIALYDGGWADWGMRLDVPVER